MWCVCVNEGGGGAGGVGREKRGGGWRREREREGCGVRGAVISLKESSPLQVYISIIADLRMKYTGNVI